MNDEHGENETPQANRQQNTTPLATPEQSAAPGRSGRADQDAGFDASQGINEATQEIAQFSAGPTNQHVNDQNADRRQRDGQQTSRSSTAPEGSASSGRPFAVGRHADTSERKKEANRENAQHSTGPKTEHGKRTVSGNALDHGFFATDAVMGGVDGWEDNEAFVMLHDALKRDWAPQGATEESLVHEIAVADWRLRRCYRSEVGEIQRTARSFHAHRFCGTPKHTAMGNAILAVGPQPFPAASENASAGARLMLLSDIRQEVERSGYVSVTSQEELDKSFGNHASSFATKCYELSYLARREQSSEERDSSDLQRKKILRLLHPDRFQEVNAEECKRVLLREIECAIEMAKITHEQVEEAERGDRIATLMTLNLPSPEFVEKLVRYEAALQRKKEKAIKLLLQLQGRRRERASLNL